MTQPTPVRCPAIEHPDIPISDPAALEPLLTRLRSARPVGTDETFPLGTVRADGRIDLCKQGLGAGGAARLMPVAAGSPHATHVLLGTNAIGDEGARSVAAAPATRTGAGAGPVPRQAVFARSPSRKPGCRGRGCRVARTAVDRARSARQLRLTGGTVEIAATLGAEVRLRGGWAMDFSSVPAPRS